VLEQLKAVYLFFLYLMLSQLLLLKQEAIDTGMLTQQKYGGGVVDHEKEILTVIV